MESTPTFERSSIFDRKASKKEDVIKPDDVFVIMTVDTSRRPISMAYDAGKRAIHEYNGVKPSS